ncbi:helix-turn-helix transcriptional regulator [Yersinia alsatica]|uniref:helix-turn-helix transcriptional regulator n=1 Tax=Yersinia alsatica TaxID=2890317 RepID=UPI0005E0E9A2|nr:AlpA family transcriptional regulator [Yersinia alsatica]OWF72585.1 transcriptional regulator [Yersinia frederiksenii]CNI88796.1 AlpA family transcriptional regulator [Yersinia frederiksenii]
MTNITLIRLPNVMQKTGLKKSWIYLLMKQGEFPQSVKIGARSVAWVENEVNNWVLDKVNKREEGQE